MNAPFFSHAFFEDCSLCNRSSTPSTSICTCIPIMRLAPPVSNQTLEFLAVCHVHVLLAWCCFLRDSLFDSGERNPSYSPFESVRAPSLVIGPFPPTCTIILYTRSRVGRNVILNPRGAVTMMTTIACIRKNLVSHIASNPTCWLPFLAQILLHYPPYVWNHRADGRTLFIDLISF